MYVGIHTASLPQALASAKRRIILHTAMYDGLANAEMSLALSVALSQPSFEKLSIITVPFVSRKQWLDEFLMVLRPERSLAEIEHVFNASRDFIVRLAVRHEGLVEVYETQAMPCAPCIIVDDTIFFGHYTHGPVSLDAGYWFSVTAPTAQLFEWAAAGVVPDQATPRQKASFRFVADCYHAMKSAKRMLL
ncbi:MAG: hypothetical protein R3Y11_06820 [Pseudomonadota bacterium]